MRMALSKLHRVWAIVWVISVLNAATIAADNACVRQDEFESRLASFEKQLQQLRDENAALQEKVKVVDAAMTSSMLFFTDLSTLDQSETSQRTGKRFVVSGEEVGAAFSVTIATDGIENLGVNQTVHFDKVVSNYGNHFDTHLSVFRAPMAGWYVFSITLMARPQHVQYLYVVKNGVMMFHVYSQGTDYATDSKTMVLHLNQADDVWVQTSESTGYSHVIHGSEHTSFTGFLLYTD